MTSNQSKKNLEKINLDESQEIDQIINLQKRLQKVDINKNLNISIDKSLDWLNFFFADNQIKNLYNNYERIRCIIILQSIFYLNFYKNIQNFKNKFNSNFNEKEENLNNVSQKFNQNLGSDQLPLIKFNNSLIYNNFSNENMIEGNVNNEISQIHLNEFVEIDNKIVEQKIADTKFFNPDFSPTRRLLPFAETNYKSSKGLTFKDSKKNNIYNKTLNNFNFPNQSLFTVGIIGCGCIGELLAKYFIRIKDSDLINFKLIISTRRPNKVDEDILNLVDENVDILLDNEKVFEEADLIFLCIQPHQLDFLVKEIYQPLNDRLEKLRRKKTKIFPTLISILSGVTLEKLKSLLPDDLNILRTTIHTEIICYYDEIYSDKNYDNKKEDNCLKNNGNRLKIEINRIRSINPKVENHKQIINTHNKSELNASDVSFMKGGIFIPKDLTKYKEEAFDHIFFDLEIFKNSLIGFYKGFNSNKTSGNNKNEFPMINVNQFLNLNQQNKKKANNLMNITGQNFNKLNKLNNEDFFYFTIFKILLGDNFESMLKSYDQSVFKSLSGLDEEILKKIKEYNSEIFDSIFKNIEN